MTEQNERSFFKKYKPIIKGLLLVGSFVILLALWLRVWGITRTLTFVNTNFSHILAHIFIYALLGSLMLLIAPYLLSRPKIYLAAIIPLLILPRLLQLFTTNLSSLQIFSVFSLLIDLLGAILAFIVFQRLFSKLIVPLFESVNDMTDLAMVQYKVRTFEQKNTNVSLLFANNIIDVQDILETLAFLAAGVTLETIAQIKGYKKESVLEWLQKANTHHLIIETYLSANYNLSKQQLKKMWSRLDFS